MSDEKNEDYEAQEVWAKVYFNGYFLTFKDLDVNVEIKISDDKCTTCILFPPLEGKEDGSIEVTELLHTFLSHIKDNPGKKVSAYLTSFSKKLHFDKDLLSAPIPQSLIDMFKNDKETDS